jgi:hypothetical protein
MTDLKFPTVHINGTSKQELLEQYISACTALRNALVTLSSIYPNGRDYYPQGPNAIHEAMEQHSNRMAKLRAVLAEIEQLAEHVA